MPGGTDSSPGAARAGQATGALAARLDCSAPGDRAVSFAHPLSPRGGTVHLVYVVETAQARPAGGSVARDLIARGPRPILVLGPGRA